MLCSEVVISTKENIEIVAPEKGEEISKKEYAATIRNKMIEMRNNRMEGVEAGKISFITR